MPNMNEQTPTPRKILPIIYVMDVSGSMTGAPIASVNKAMRETMPILEEISDKNPNALLKIAAMTFSSNVNWVSNRPDGRVVLEELEDFFWNDVTAGGLTNLGLALEELHKQMSRNALFQSDTGFKLPVIIFMSDGGPTDSWESTLDKLNNENKWFANGTKIAIAIGDDADTTVLAKVVGSPEAVISVNDLDVLKQLIVVISATASKIGTVSRLTTEISGTSVIQEVKKQMGQAISGVVADVSSSANPSVSTISKDADGWDDDDWN